MAFTNYKIGDLVSSNYHNGLVGVIIKKERAYSNSVYKYTVFFIKNNRTVIQFYYEMKKIKINKRII